MTQTPAKFSQIAGAQSCSAATTPLSIPSRSMEGAESQSPQSSTTATPSSPIAGHFREPSTIKSWRSIGSITTGGTCRETFDSQRAEKIPITEGIASLPNGKERRSPFSGGRAKIQILIRILLLGTYAGVCRLKRFIAGNAGPIRLYDLVDAGPRHRFTTALFEVHNCLGGGYQCWTKGFVRAAKDLAGLTFTEDEALPHVQGYRKANPEIVKYWDWHQKWMARSAIMHDPVHEVELASGRHIRYFHPEAHTDAKGRASYDAEIVCGERKMRRWFFGGKLTENEMQATARDVMRDGILEAEDRGIPTHFTVHDELVTSVPTDQAEDAKRELENLLPTAAKWALDCPLGVDVKISDRYMK